MNHRTIAAKTAATLALREVTAEYFPGQPILRELTLVTEPGKLAVIIGPNGSGKSTALRVLAGLLRPSAGRVVLETATDERDVSDVAAHQRSALGISYLPQGHSVFPAMSVHENLLMGAWCLGLPARAVRATTAQAYDRYPVLRAKRSALAGSLSGGQQRILELARALIPNPSILLVDEPSAGVAPDVAALMYRELAQLRDEGHTVILVDQDVRAALAVADAVYVLKSGRIDRYGPASAITDLDALVQDWLSITPTMSEPSSAEEEC